MGRISRISRIGRAARVGGNSFPSPTDFWRLDADANDYGAAPANNLTASGAGVTFGPGYAALDGTDTLASGTGVFGPAGNFTLAGWVYFNATGLATLWGTVNGAPGAFLSTRTTRFEAHLFNGSAWQFAQKSYTQAAETWYFVSLTYNATSRVASLDLNNSGTPGTVALTTPLTFNSPANAFKVGENNTGFGNLAGRVRLLGFWNGKILSAEHLAILYGGGTPFDPTA